MLSSFFGGGNNKTTTTRAAEKETSESKREVEDQSKTATANLRESISEIEVSPPITRSWLYVNDQIKKVASVLSQDKESASPSSCSVIADSLSSSTTSSSVREKGLWELSGFDGVRYLLEAGKLNVLLRIVLEYATFMQTPGGRDSIKLNEDECAAFEKNCSIIFQASWKHAESVQTSELPLSASVLVSIMSICISMGLEGETFRTTSGSSKHNNHHNHHEQVSDHLKYVPHPRPQLIILALTMWSSLGSTKAISAVGDDKLAKEILRAQPTYSCFALFPVFALLCLNTSAPQSTTSKTSFSSPPSSTDSSERNFLLLILSALEGASRIANSEDFQSSRNKLLIEADQAIFKAMTTVRSDSAISALSTATTPSLSSACEKLKSALTPDIHPRFAASACITSMEARAKTRSFLDFCDAAIRRMNISKKSTESKE